MAFKLIRFKVAGYEPVGAISTIAHLLKPFPAHNSLKTKFYASTNLGLWITFVHGHFFTKKPRRKTLKTDAI